MIKSKVALKGKLDWKVYRGGRKVSFSWKLRNQLRWSYIKGWLATKIVGPIANIFGVMTVLSELRAIKYGADGTYVDYGVVGRRVVTTAYCTFLALNHKTDSTELGDYKFHDSGVGTTAEAAADTAMETTDGAARGSGTQVNSGVTYTSVGTVSYTGTYAITEHGLFSTLASTTLMDRTVFAAINVVSGDSIQFSYTLTFTAGS